MRAVNLLPDADRPQRVQAAPPRASAAVLGSLAFVLLAVALYVFTANQITSKKDETATANRETQSFKAQGASLQAYADFRSVKTTRVNSITELASKRFDWERLMRELALVLPDKVWLNSVNGGSDAATTGASGSASPTATPADATAAASTAGPTVKLAGCAPSQRSVADVIVRLRSLHGVDDAQLQDSTRSTAGDGPGASGGAADSGGDCGKSYAFNATVSFSSPAAQSPATRPQRVPRRLGGGA